MTVLTELNLNVTANFARVQVVTLLFIIEFIRSVFVLVCRNPKYFIQKRTIGKK